MQWLAETVAEVSRQNDEEHDDRIAPVALCMSLSLSKAKNHVAGQQIIIYILKL